MADKEILKKELFRSIERYYVKGFETSERGSDWYAVNKIVDDKIIKVINNDLPPNVANLLKDLRKTFKNFNITGEFHLQFPSYSFSIELKERNLEYVTLISNIKIKLSLIYPCFTVFFEETTSHKNISRFRPIIFRILSSNNSNLDPERDYYNTIIALISKNFSGYIYANHQMLFLNKMPNFFPYNYQYNYRGKHYLYEFLFDDIYNSGNLEVTF